MVANYRDHMGQPGDAAAVVDVSPSGWREARLDMLLAEELSVSPSFAKHFASAALESAKCRAPHGPPKVVVRFNFWHEVDDGSHGENDLDVTLTWADGTTRRLLVEDKVWAPLQPRQAERYRVRAEACCGGAAILVAPKRWLDAHQEAVKEFHGHHSIEELAKWLRNNAEGVEAARLIWRAGLLDELAKPRVVGMALDHPPTIAFRDHCVAWLAERASTAEVWPLSLHTQGQQWLWFRYPRDLYFKAGNGTVDLYARVNGFAGGAAELRARLASSPLPADFFVATDTSERRNIVLRRNVSTFTTGAGVPADRSALDEALGACQQIIAWFEQGGANLLRAT